MTRTEKIAHLEAQAKERQDYIDQLELRWIQLYEDHRQIVTAMEEKMSALTQQLQQLQRTPSPLAKNGNL